ncbi:MAG TPA: hypothetical protein VH274_01375 [Mycobacteriales bacterium]|nr:hypothetical protein [Mycobacteriales bacterium]
MTELGPVEPDDLADVAATDTLLDQFGATREARPTHVDDTDSLLTLLVDWRTELDDRAATGLTTDVPVVPAASRRWIRVHRRTAAATAIVVALAGSTGVAAAASGPTGPLGGLHKLFFGDSPSVPRLDGLARLAANTLDEAGTAIRAAARAGSITTAAQNTLSAQLDRVETLLHGDALAPQGLIDRLSRLRTTLAAIPVSDPTPPVVTDNHGRSGHGADDTGTDDRTGRSRSTDDGGGHGSDDGSSGSDHGGDSGSGVSGSGDSSGDGGSGGDGGSASGGDSGSTSGGDSGSASGGDDGSTSGGDSGSNSGRD